jgi:hypothetical protein
MLACMFLLTSGFWNNFPWSCYQNFPLEFISLKSLFFCILWMEFQRETIIILYVYHCTSVKINGDTLWKIIKIYGFYRRMSRICDCSRKSPFGLTTPYDFIDPSTLGLAMRMKGPNKKLEKIGSIKSYSLQLEIRVSLAVLSKWLPIALFFGDNN